MNHNFFRVTVATLFAVAFVGSYPVHAQETTQQTPTTTDDSIPVDDAPADETIPEDTAPADDTIPEDTAPAETDKPATNDRPAMNPAPADPNLLPVYKDFGELPGLTALMDDFMTQLLADPRTRPFFEQADQASVKKHLTEQFCVILGGPCTYTGRDMKTTHDGLGITRGNFNALVEDLQIVMNRRRIPFHSQNKLLAKLAPMHRDIESK
jgi:hemoglobin